MNVVEIINEAIASGRTRFAFELLPPLKGDGMQKIFAAVEPLMALDPAYVNITFHREGIKETEREDGSVEWHRTITHTNLCRSGGYGFLHRGLRGFCGGDCRRLCCRRGRQSCGRIIHKFYGII